MNPLFEIDSYTPAQFFEHLYPTWARVYVEVFDEIKDSIGPEELIWRDRRVSDAVTRLIGFDAAEYAHRDLRAQLEYLQLARTACVGLYQADEVAQLDGRPALDFAQGWMACHWWLRKEMVLCPADGGSCNAECPSELVIKTASKRHQTMHHPSFPDAFDHGFAAHASLHIGQRSVACNLSPHPAATNK